MGGGPGGGVGGSQGKNESAESAVRLLNHGFFLVVPECLRTGRPTSKQAKKRFENRQTVGGK